MALMAEFSTGAEMTAHYRAVRARTRFFTIPEPLSKPKLEWWPPRIEPVFSADELALFAILAEGPVSATIPRSYPPIPRIKKVVCQYYGFTHADLISHRRTKDVTRARQIAVWLCRVLTPASFPEIGKQFGDRDHTTQLCAYRKIERLRQTDQQLQSDLNELKAALEI